jgi:hypothetical protein
METKFGSENPGEKRPFGIHGGRWEDNIKICQRSSSWGHYLGVSPGAQSPEVVWLRGWPRPWGGKTTGIKPCEQSPKGGRVLLGKEKSSAGGNPGVRNPEIATLWVRFAPRRIPEGCLVRRLKTQQTDRQTDKQTWTGP